MNRRALIFGGAAAGISQVLPVQAEQIQKPIASFYIRMNTVEELREVYERFFAPHDHRVLWFDHYNPYPGFKVWIFEYAKETDALPSPNTWGYFNYLNSDYAWNGYISTPETGILRANPFDRLDIPDIYRQMSL